MRIINVKPVEIVGHCRAGLTLEDEFQVQGVRIVNPGQKSLCLRALSYLPPTVMQLQQGRRFLAHVTCSECNHLERMNCVVFLLGHADKWALCQAISEYDHLCGECREPDLARRWRTEAMQHHVQGEYTEAVRKMDAALQELRRVANWNGGEQGNAYRRNSRQ